MTSRLHAGLAVWKAKVKKPRLRQTFVQCDGTGARFCVCLLFRQNSPWLTQSIDQHLHDVVEIQSIGAAIQNMLLAATELGLGSLWIADVFELARN